MVNITSTFSYSKDGTNFSNSIAVKQGDTLTIKATFTGNIENTPRLLSTGLSSDISDNFTATSGDRTIWTYSYTVPNTDETATLSIFAYANDHGDFYDNTQTPSNNTFTIDNTSVVITSIFVASSNNNTTTRAKENDKIIFTVAFNDDVTLSAAYDVKVPFTIGTTSKEAIAQSTNTATINTTANAINFEYTVEAGLNGSVALVAGPLTQSNSATVLDAAGNALIGNMTTLNGGVTVDTTPPVITPIINTISFSWGAVLNATEDNADGTVTVTTVGVENGQTLTITLNGSTYTASVSSNAARVTIPRVDLQALTDGQSYTLTADVSDAAGNAAAQVTSSFKVDTTVPSINAISTSWGAVLNATEDNTDGTVTVTTVGVEDGQPLIITLNSSTYTASVSSNSATVTIPAAGLQALVHGQSYILTADVSDAAGNAAAQVTSSPFNVDTTPPAAPIINEAPSITNNNTPTINVEFTSSSDDKNVRVFANDTENIVVDVDNINNNEITLNTLVDGSYAITVKLEDNAGNLSVASNTKNITIDTVSPTISITNASLTARYNNEIIFQASKNLYYNNNLLSSTNNPATNNTNTNQLFTSDGLPAYGTDGSSTRTPIDSTFTIKNSRTITFIFSPPSVNTIIYFKFHGTITDRAGNRITIESIDLSNKFSLNSQSCFLEHTLVRTDQGYVQISKLDPCLHTIRNMKIKALIKSTLLDDEMVFIQKDALYNNVPCEDTYMTRHHKVFYNKGLVKGSSLVNMQKASYKNIKKSTHVYNVLMEKHNKMLINNMIVETQSPDSAIGRLYNHFLLNKKCNKEHAQKAIQYLELFSNDIWFNLQELNNGACPKTMFINYLENTKKENKKQVQSIMKQLM